VPLLAVILRGVKAEEFHGYSITTDLMRVTVVPEHLEENSSPEDQIFAFSYTVRIENLSSVAVQLLERHWLISSGGSHLAEVVGPGVVGEQPLLKPGAVYEYTSTAVIQDPTGDMVGSYTFRSECGSYFEVPIPKFDLHYPLLIH